MRWVEHYMPRAQAEFDAHALKVREVIDEWLAQPEGEREIGFLKVLNRHWNHLNDSESGYGFDQKSDEYIALGIIMVVYRYQVGRAYAALQPFQHEYEQKLNA